MIVVERTGVIEAFGRSRELVRGNGWQVFGVIFTVFVITVIVGIIFSAIAVGISDSAAMRILFNVIAETITAPIAALVAAVIYFRLIAIGDSAPTPGAPPPPPPPPAAEPGSPPAV